MPLFRAQSASQAACDFVRLNMTNIAKVIKDISIDSIKSQNVVVFYLSMFIAVLNFDSIKRFISFLALKQF